MDDDEHDERIIQSGRFKGKKIELASTAGVELFSDVGREFMLQIFGLEADDYLITDESSLRDFTGVADLDLAEILEKVRRLYGLDVSDVEGGKLLNVFMRVHERGTAAGRTD